jgi:DNA ligase 1
VKAFATLLDKLTYTPARNGKLRLLSDYFLATPDPDRGFALAALTDGLPFSFPVRQTVLDLASRHIDPELFRLSRDYVGDTAETLSLIWHNRGGDNVLRLADVVEILNSLGRNQFAAQMAAWLDMLDVNGRWALLKLVTGGMRTGVSARLAKLALADAFRQPVEEIEEVWHGLSPPYSPLFAWLTGEAARPDVKDAPVFRPLMLSQPLEDADLAVLDPAAHQIEWKWDGIRVQLCARASGTKLYSRSGDDISAAFPEFDNMPWRATLDGELLVVRDGVVAPFQELQQRLNRKTVTKKMLTDYPVHIRLYDMLDVAGEDIRTLTLVERRARLQGWIDATKPTRMDLSEIISVENKDTLQEIWSSTRSESIEGLMLKRRDSAYVAGRPKGLWWKWKREALTADCVMIYAQRGSGKRSSFYSDYTFACWDESKTPRELVPVGKAYSGFTDEELKKLDHFVRHHTTNRFGPVRQVEAKLVLEVAFDAIQASSRHKSGIAMRFPRISRIRWDKPAAEADTVEGLRKLAGVSGKRLN